MHDRLRSEQIKEIPMRRLPSRYRKKFRMHRNFAAAVMMMAGLLGQVRAVIAQDTAQPITAPRVYVVTYMEVAPKFSSEARQLILAHGIDARKAPGAVEIDALARIDYPGHFALVEQWQSQAARQAYASTDSAMKFRTALGPVQSAGYDERIHSALSVGPPIPASADAVLIVTHVDIIPTSVDAGVGKVTGFAEQGRVTPGNRRFDVLVQASRKNHMTIIESWDSLADKSSWISTPAARSFRENLQPMSGSLYDERAYRLLR
jgi:quinol monooxygenase YgiN